MEVTKDQIDLCFEKAVNQNEYLVNLYKIPFPDWDEIKSISGFPHVGKELAYYIMGKAMDFDRVHHPNIMNGGLILNSGFGQDDKLGAWELSLEGVEVEYLEDAI